MKITFEALVTIFILSLLFPFFYFFQIESNPLLSTPMAVYPIVSICSVFFAFFIEKNIRCTISLKTKNAIIITAALLVILYATILFILTLTRFYGYISQAVDIHFFNQEIKQL